MRVFYGEDIYVGEVVTNQFMSVDRALDLLSFDEEDFCKEHGFDNIDINEFRLEY